MADKVEIDARLIFEAQGSPKDRVEEILGKLLEELGRQDGVTVYETKKQETVERKEKDFTYYSALTDAGCRFKDFETLFSIVLNFGPTAMIMKSPDKLQIDAREIQNAVGDLSALLHTLAQENARMRTQNQAMFSALKQAGAFDPAEAGPADGEPQEEKK